MLGEVKSNQFGKIVTTKGDLNSVVLHGKITENNLPIQTGQGILCKRSQR